MIFLIYFLAVFGLGRCLDPLASRHEIETSINRTIIEVERLIKIDPTLPQLTRNQIVDILYNITTQDMDLLEDSVEKTRSDYQRALTVVLPYNSKDAKNEDIKDLYTKPPMIHVIPDSETMLPYSSIQEESPASSDRISDNVISKKSQNESKNQFPNINNNYKNHRTTYTDVEKVDSMPLKFSLNFNNLNTSKSMWPTTNSISKLINSDNNRNSMTKPKLEIIYSTSISDNPTTKMMRTTTLRTSEEFKPTMATTKSTVNVLTSDQWKYFAPPSTTTTTTTTAATITTQKPLKMKRKPSTIERRPPRPSQFQQKPQPFLPTVLSTSSEWPTHPTHSTWRQTSELSSKSPSVGTFNMADMEMMSDTQTPMIMVTPIFSKSTEKILNSTSATGLIADYKKKVAQTPAPLRENVAVLLASIGLEPSKVPEIDSNKINPINKQGIFATNFEIPKYNNTTPSESLALTANNVDSSLIFDQNTFDNTHKDVRKGANNLSSDVQLLFQRFGLQTSNNDATSTTTKAPTRFSYRPNSWNSFKPLPKSEVKDESMKNFLATFGLGMSENRNQKSMKQSMEDSVIDAVPSSMKNILENIGLIVRSKVPRNVKSITPTTTTAIISTKRSTTEDPTKIHVFKPHEAIIGDPQQKLKINELLDTVKLVQEGEADVSHVHKAANDLLKSTKTLQAGPNPLSSDEILRMSNNDVKNEVKRQEPKANLSNDTTTASNDSDTSEAELELSGDNSSKNSSGSVIKSADSVDDNSEVRVVTSSVTTPTLTAAATATLTTTVATTESSKSTSDDSNLEALADSFGGSTVEPDPVLPTPKKSGLYFLVDWNSFLEVGVDGEDKVNLKFAPKVGDRTRFIPVVVP